MAPNQKSEAEMREVLVYRASSSVVASMLVVSSPRFAQTQKYGKHVRQSQAQREQMASFIQDMKNHDENQQKRFDQVLNAGKSKVKRHYAHDGGSADDQSYLP